MSNEILTELEVVEMRLSELLKMGARFRYGKKCADEIKSKCLPLNVILPGKIHEIEIEMKFTDE